MERLTRDQLVQHAVYNKIPGWKGARNRGKAALVELIQRGGRRKEQSIHDIWTLARKMNIRQVQHKKKEFLKREIKLKIREDPTLLKLWTDDDIVSYMKDNGLLIPPSSKRHDWIMMIIDSFDLAATRKPTFAMKRKAEDEDGLGVKRSKNWRKYSAVFGSEFRREYQLKPLQRYVDYTKEVEALSEPLQDVLQETWTSFESFSFQISVQVEYWKMILQNDATLKQEDIMVWFYIPREYILSEEDIGGAISTCRKNIIERIETYALRGSGWTFRQLKQVDLIVSKYRPLVGASTYISTPKTLSDKHCVINVRNGDDMCFFWSILAALHPASDNPDRLSHYEKYAAEVDVSDITFPLVLDKSTFAHIRQKNPKIPFNIFIWNEEEGKKWEVLPFSLDPNKPNEAIDLLYIPHPDDSSPGHFVWIKHFQRLVHDLNHHDGKKFICRKCFSHYPSKERLHSHTQDCKLEDMTIKKLPVCKKCPEYDATCSQCQDAATFRFRRFEAQQICPLFIVADFESYLVPITEPHGQMEKIHRHEPASFALKVVVDPMYEHLECFQKYVDMPMIVETAETLDNDLSKTFLEIVSELGKNIRSHVAAQDLPLDWTEDDKWQFAMESKCHICHEEILPVEIKVCDHDHLTGAYRGAAHQRCNVNFSLKNWKVPIFFHNLKGYDSKFILRDLGKLSQTDIVEKLSVLAQNSEKFKSISLGPVRFVDSFAHLTSSLGELTRVLRSGCEEEDLNASRAIFKTLSKEFPQDLQFQLLLRKGIFPYRFLSGPEKLALKELPPHSVFEENVTKEEYEHACKVWEMCGVQSLREYMELYVKTDVLLLCDILLNYRKVSYQNYKLDPCWFLTAPALSFAAALKMSKVKLELITDMDMYNFIEKSVRGGLSYIAQREATATEDPSDSQKNSFIGYWDVNNLYGKSMSMPQPLCKYEWIDPSSWKDVFGPQLLNGRCFEDVLEELHEQEMNYYLEIDAEFPASIHGKMSDYPMLPETMVPPNGFTPKLINHLGIRRRYVLTYENYLLALQHKVVFTKIHRILRFQQGAWLKSYVLFNTEQRQLAKTKFEADFYKLMVNSCFGKTLEQVMKFSNFELFTRRSTQFKKIHQRKPYLIKHETVYNLCTEHTDDPDAELCNNLNSCVLGMQKFKQKAVLDRPIFVGSRILELSKTIMMNLYYNHLIPYFGRNLRLLMSDTDSFVVHIQSPDLCADLLNLRSVFDFSNFPRDSVLYSTENHRVPGKLKEEYAGERLIRFIGLRSKCYALETEKMKEIKRAKGVKKNVVHDNVCMNDYQMCLDYLESVVCKKQELIRSFKQTLYTVRQTKVALSAHDDKRYICADGRSTLPWGHKDIPCEDSI
jgi:hypothetical protein